MAGRVGASRRAGQALCAAVLRLPLSTGAIQPLGDRGAEAMVPHDAARGAVARTASVNYLAETAWRTHGTRHGRWGMANPEGASLQSPRHRSKAAVAQRMADGRGILGSDGDRVSQAGQGLRQRCLAHLLRPATGLAESVEAGLAGCGGRRHAARQRLCHMRTERPPGGQWRAW